MRKFLVLFLLLLTPLGLAQSIWINDDGTLREIDTVWINDDGTLRQIDSGWINDSGTLRQFYASGPTVTVSGDFNSASNVGSNAYAYFKVDQDGNMYERDNSDSYVQIDSAADWIRPVDDAPGAYQVRYTSCTGDCGDVGSISSADAWYTLSTADWYVYVYDSTPFFGGKSATFTIEIRLGTGDVLDSGSYTATADREDS